MHLAAAIGLVAIAAIISAAITPVVVRLCQKYKVLDTPGQRKIHTHGIPRLGGAAVFVAISISMTAAVYGILGEYVGLPEEQLKLIPLIYAGLCGFFFIGFVDDVRSLPALPRLAAQLIVATLVVLFPTSLTKPSTLAVPAPTVPAPISSSKFSILSSMSIRHHFSYAFCSEFSSPRSFAIP